MLLFLMDHSFIEVKGIRGLRIAGSIMPVSHALKMLMKFVFEAKYTMYM